MEAMGAIFLKCRNDIPSWIVALISALCAFVVGVLLEPVRLHIKSRHDKNRLRKKLYDEVTELWFHVDFIEIEKNNRSDKPLKFSPIVYEQARTNTDLMFYELPEARNLIALYEDTSWVLQPVRPVYISDHKIEAARIAIEGFAQFHGHWSLFRNINRGMINDIEKRNKKRAEEKKKADL